LFWKKKNKKSPLFVAPEDPRGAFRVKPHPDYPVIVTVEGTSFVVEDISSGGISFKNRGYKLNQVYDALLALPHSDTEFFLILKIIRIGDGDICHCSFVAPDPKIEDDIHYYVLLRQKQELSEKE